MNTRMPHRLTEKGAALIAVFWLIALLGLILFTGARLLEADTNVMRVNRGRIFAQRYAESGLAVARHPAITTDDSLLHFTGADGGGYDVNMRSEDARLNINTLALSVDRTPLTRLFASWGMRSDEAAALSDALKDWVDTDDLVSLNGAEKNEYAREGLDGMPFNHPFRDLDEMALVRGMDRLTMIKPDWRDFFTVHGDGRLDINEAQPELIAAIAGLPTAQIQALEDFRAGPDHVRGTSDDRGISSVAQLAKVLGIMQPQALARLNQSVRFGGNVRRIESVGYMNSTRRKFVLISQDQRVLWQGELPLP